MSMDVFITQKMEHRYLNCRSFCCHVLKAHLPSDQKALLAFWYCTSKRRKAIKVCSQKHLGQSLDLEGLEILNVVS